MSATIQRCKRCGTIYSSYGADYCSKCTEELDNYLTKIQDYLYDHEQAGIVEISDALEISSKIIMDFIRDGSLLMGEDNCVVYCENCDKPISSGRYCDECKNKLGNLFNNVLESHKKEEPVDKPKKARMHTRH